MEGLYFGFLTLRFINSNIYLMDTRNYQIDIRVDLMIR